MIENFDCIIDKEMPRNFSIDFDSMFWKSKIYYGLDRHILHKGSIKGATQRAKRPNPSKNHQIRPTIITLHSRERLHIKWGTMTCQPYKGRLEIWKVILFLLKIDAKTFMAFSTPMV